MSTLANLGWLLPLGFLALAAAMLAVFMVFPSGKTAAAAVSSVPNNASAPPPSTKRRNWFFKIWRSFTSPFRRFWGVRDSETRIIPVGFFLGPVSAHIWFGITIFTVSIAIALLMAGLVAPLNPDVFLRPVVFWTIVLGPAIMMNLLAWTFTERRTVPNNHVLPLKILGRIINVLLTNGEYVIPLFPFLASNRDNVTGDVVKDSEENSPDENKKGLIYVGTITAHLGKEGEGGQGLMLAAAADKANVKLRPTVNYTCTNPLQRLPRSRPIKDMNEAARDAVRQALASTVTGDQANDMQKALAQMVAGWGFYGIRTRDSNAASGVHGGNLVTDAATGRILYLVKNQTEATPEDFAELIREVELKGKESMKIAARNRQTGLLEPFFAYVATGFKRALTENGYTLEGYPRIGEIELPDPVTRAAAQAAAEVAERQAALAQAETSRLAGETLTRGQAALSGTDAAMAGLAMENDNIKVIHVSGLSNGGGSVIINPT